MKYFLWQSAPLKLELKSLTLTSATGGELFQKIVREDSLTESEAAFYIRQILIALEYMHSQNVIHLDLKVMTLHFCVKLIYSGGK